MEYGQISLSGNLKENFDENHAVQLVKMAAGFQREAANKKTQEQNFEESSNIQI
jgi:hypothetical protein